MLALYLEWLAAWWWAILAAALIVDTLTVLVLWLISRRL